MLTCFCFSFGDSPSDDSQSVRRHRFLVNQGGRNTETFTDGAVPAVTPAKVCGR